MLGEVLKKKVFKNALSLGKKKKLREGRLLTVRETSKGKIENSASMTLKQKEGGTRGR